MSTMNRDEKFRTFLAHEKDDSVLLVRNYVKVQTDFAVYVPVSICLFSTFAISVMFRKVFRMLSHEADQEISRILLSTLGALLLTQPSDRVRNRPERILYFFFVVFAMLVSILASAILLGNILAKETQTDMNTLKELAESGLPVCITEELNDTRDDWSQFLE